MAAINTRDEIVDDGYATEVIPMSSPDMKPKAKKTIMKKKKKNSKSIANLLKKTKAKQMKAKANSRIDEFNADHHLCRQQSDVTAKEIERLHHENSRLAHQNRILLRLLLTSSVTCYHDDEQ